MVLSCEARAAEPRLIGWHGETHRVVKARPEGGARARRRGKGAVADGEDGEDGRTEDGEAPFACAAPPAGAQSTAFVARSSKALRYAHMAMAHALPNGTLLVAWQASALKEGEHDQHIRLASVHEGGEPSPSVAAPLPARGALWGPLLFVDDADASALHLLYSESHGGCPGGPMRWAPGGDVMATRAALPEHDGWSYGDLAWEQPRVVYPQEADGGIPKVTANKPVAFDHDGARRWVLPFWRERALLNTKDANCKAHMRGKQSAGVLVTVDGGETWAAHGAIALPTTWLIEQAVAHLNRGRLLMVMRTRAGHIYGARSEDAGETWGAAAPLHASRQDVARGFPRFLPNPNAKIDMIRLPPSSLGGDPDRVVLALAFNDHMQPRDDPAGIGAQGCVKCRTRLTVATSTDLGRSWTRVGPAFEDEVGASLRLHYPTLLPHPRDACAVLVAYSRFYVKQTVTADMLPTQGVKLASVPLADAGAAARMA